MERFLPVQSPDRKYAARSLAPKRSLRLRPRLGRGCQSRSMPTQRVPPQTGSGAFCKRLEACSIIVAIISPAARNTDGECVRYTFAAMGASASRAVRFQVASDQALI